MTNTPDFTTGQWAYRLAPTVQVAVPITARPGRYPVMSMDASGVLRSHHANGRWVSGCISGTYDLVPLVLPAPPPAPLIERWVNVYFGGSLGPIYATREEADKGADPSRIRCVHLREVEDQA